MLMISSPHNQESLVLVHGEDGRAALQAALAPFVSGIDYILSERHANFLSGGPDRGGIELIKIINPDMLLLWKLRYQ